MSYQDLQSTVISGTNSRIDALERYIGSVADLNANRHRQGLIDDRNRDRLIRELQSRVDILRVQIWLTAVSTSLISITASTIIVAATL